MMKYIRQCSHFFLLSLPLLFLSAAQAGTTTRTPDFEQLDINKDGLISWQEYVARKPVSGRINPRRIFDNVDTNLDGYISRAEYRKMKQRRKR